MGADLDDPVAGLTRLAGPRGRLLVAPQVAHMRAPLLGEYTRQVLLGLGYTEAEIAALEAENVIKCAGG